jgi:hypothetical protein
MAKRRSEVDIGELLLLLNAGKREKVRGSRYRTGRKEKLARRTGLGGALFSDG